MPHPPEFADTDPRAMEVWLSLQRNMAQGDKLIAVLDASALVLSTYEAGVFNTRIQVRVRGGSIASALHGISRPTMDVE